MLDVTDLRVRYGAIEALRGVSLRVDEHELVCLLGANGAGKTTLLRALSGLEPIADGSATYEGRELGRIPAERIARSGLVHVPEGRRVFGRMTVEENLRVAAWGRRGDLDEDLTRVMDLFPILAERRDQLAYSMSGGEQQMLALGRALMRRPKLLMLDEPSMGLAPLIVQRVFELIVEIHRQGTTILLVEQNARMALQVAGRAYVLENGAITAEGDAAELADSPEIQRAYLGGVPTTEVSHER